jgi:hypothetical protein
MPVTVQPAFRLATARCQLRELHWHCVSSPEATRSNRSSNLPRLRGAFSFGGRAVWREVCKAVTARADAFATDLAPTVAELRASGAATLQAIADGLNRSGIPTTSGRGEWQPVQVSRVLARLR